jgi:Icc protein
LLTNPEQLAEVIHGRSQLVAILTGHTHTAAAAVFAGRPLLIAPGIVSTLRLDWEPGSGLVDEDAPAGVAFHVIDEQRSIFTHYRPVV